MEMTTCEVADSVQADNYQREEQCDDCFTIDHLKECEWCEHYDHPTRKLQVQHQSSDFPSDVPSIDECWHIGKKTGFNPATMFSQITEDEDEGDRTAAITQSGTENCLFSWKIAK
jgi:hypothetical protein